MSKTAWSSRSVALCHSVRHPCYTETAVPRNWLGELRISLPVSSKAVYGKTSKAEVFVNSLIVYIQSGAYAVYIAPHKPELSLFSLAKGIYLTVSSLLVKKKTKKRKAFHSWTV